MVIGLDVGGTNLKAARVDGEGRILDRRHEPITKDSLGPLLDQLAGAADALDPGRTLPVGIGVPAIVERNQLVRASPNVPILDGIAIGDALFQRTGRPTYIENDANAAALAEAWLGASGPAENLLFVTLGTGVGGGVVLNDRVWVGRSGYAGEIGHIRVEDPGYPCGCGGTGCIETIAGAAGWVRLAEARLADGRDSLLRNAALSPSAISQAAHDGDAVALEVMDQVARALGVGIGAALLLLNLDQVVVGGGVAAAGALLLDRIAAHVQARTFPQVFADAQIRLAQLGGDAGVIGAARVAMLKGTLPA